ncbi:MAG: AAA family ATPase [Acidobacteriota bacterium]
MVPLPPWAEVMRELYRSGSNSQFILHGSVFDLVEAPDVEDGTRFLSLREYLTDVMFSPFDVVIHYDRGRGIRVPKGGDLFHRFLKAFDSFQGTAWAGLPDSGPDRLTSLDLGNLLPRDPKRALELINRFLRGSRNWRREEAGAESTGSLGVAVLIDYAEFIVPRGDPLYLMGEVSQNLIQLLDWSNDPTLTSTRLATVIVTENLTDLNQTFVENPYSAKIKIELPSAAEVLAYVAHVVADRVDFDSKCEVDRSQLAEKLVGLSRVNIRNFLLRALEQGDRITLRYLTQVKKELIEKEAFGRIEFIESNRTLDDVAGHGEAKAWLREDAELLRQGRRQAIPMGYLLCGRIGTGKTYLVECLAGEIGIPVVELKNFREKWVGATEGNLERIFNILHALGQVIVFIDEADQMTGQRESGTGDSGLSGRIYGMLAREMSDTNNRGRIIWILATSRPDLLEVDLKRQGRLDVHIPLFPPGDRESRQALFRAMAHKVGLEIAAVEIPELPDDDNLGGNEMEGILVRSLRAYSTQPDGDGRRSLPDVIRSVVRDFRPSAHVERLELMDLLAVKECTDTRFLPERFKDLSLAQVNQRTQQLKAILGE